MQSSKEAAGRASRNAERPTSKGERRTSRKVVPIAYEEAAEDMDAEEEDYNNPGATTKKMKLLPSPNAKKHKRPSSKPPTSKKSSKKGGSTKRMVLRKFDFENEFKKENFTPSVVLKQLTLQDLLQAGVKRDAVKFYTKESNNQKIQKNQSVVKSVPPPKTTPKRPSKKITKRPSAKSHPTREAPSTERNVYAEQRINIENRAAAASNVEPTREAPPLERNVYAEQRINFEATPYQVLPPVLSPIGMLPIHQKEDKERQKEDKTQMLNTYSNIKTQGDMILAIIRAVLPSLPRDKESQMYDFLADMGVENAGDLSFIEEDDLNRILKPIQSRKLIAAWKNKGVPSHSTSLTRRTCGAEPMTFVPAVFQIQNMASQNQIDDKTFPAQSETQNQSAVMQAINIPGWHQNTAAPYLGCAKNDTEPTKEVNPALPPSPTKEPSETDWTDDFVIPWDKLPLKIENCLLKKQRPDRNSRLTIVHIVCKEIHQVAEFPTRCELKKIARKMCDRFPESLCDEGESGNECMLLAQQLKNRIATLRSQCRVTMLERKSCLSENYRRKLYTDSTSKSFASSVPSPSVSSSNSCTSDSPSAVSQTPNSKDDDCKLWLDIDLNSKSSVVPNTPTILSYNAYTSSAMSHTSVAPSPSFSSLMPSVQSCISLAASNKPSTSSTQSDGDFDIPWHKFDVEILSVLSKGMKLTILQRQTLARNVVHELDKWNQYPSKKSKMMRKTAEQMRQKFPASLSNFAFGKSGGKMSSSHLASILLRRFHNSHRYQRQDAGKSRKNVKKEPAENDSSGFPDWAIIFRIPWEKMPTNILECLKKRKGLTHSLRQKMVRVICSDIQMIEENPNKESVDFIAKKVCKTYPKSLCDMSGRKVGTSYKHLGRQLFRRIQAVNCAKKRTCDFAEYNQTEQFMDVDSMVDVNVSTGMDDGDISVYHSEVEVKTNFDTNTATYSCSNRIAIEDYGSAGTGAFYDGRNSLTPLNDLPQIEQFKKAVIKKEVSEHDTNFSIKTQQEFQIGHLHEEILSE